MIQGIDVVFIHSPYKELAEWYAEVLGMQKGFFDDEWTEYQTQGVTRFAVEQTNYPRSVVDNQPIMISFRVADVRAAVDTLAARGVRFYPSLADTIFDTGPSLVATFQDPAGNWLQISQRKA